MSDVSLEFKSTTPSLTLEPVIELEKEAVVVQEEKIHEPALDDSMLTQEEKQQVEAFSNQIDVKNSTMILQYGAATQQKMAGFSEKALENVQTKDLGAVGEMLTGVVKELKEFDAVEEEKGFLGFFKKGVSKVETLKLKYNKAEVNVSKIISALEGHQIQLMKDVSMLDQMYEQNTNYFKELSMYILAGKKKIHKVKTEELGALINKANMTGNAEDAQAANDLQAMLDRFEKKIHDLELTRTIAIQTAPQIRLIQNNDTIMIDKIQSTLVNTIPLWKSQMVLALGIAHSQSAVKAQQQVNNFTNELLKKNATVLKTATIETAKENERSIVDIETLKTTNEALISTLDEVMNIQADGRVKRQEAELELGRLEGELKAKLLEIRR